MMDFDTTDRPVQNWEARDGFVYVDSQRVLGPYKCTGVRVKRAFQLVCAPCAIRGNGHYTAPAMLMVRYEHALDRHMYYFSAAHLCPRHGKQPRV